MEELIKATKGIYSLVKVAQERRAQIAAKDSVAAKVPRILNVGEHAYYVRPPPELRNKTERQVSKKLQTKARPGIYKIIKAFRDYNYILGDIATGAEIKQFKQPVHSDRLIAVSSDDLDQPASEKLNISIEGWQGVVH